MSNKSYLKGYNFERRVRKMLEKQGFLVIRSGKSRFPDGVAISLLETIIFECKCNKYLSKEEKEQAKKIYEITNIPLTVYYRKDRKLLKYEVEQ